MLTFNAIDVETANADRASICQVGVVHVQDGVVTDGWSSLVNPNSWFDPMNVMVHGLTEADVADSPTFEDVLPELRERLAGSVVVSHTAFDRVALIRAMGIDAFNEMRVTWLDSARVVRRAWPERYARSGWGLGNVAYDLDIDFRHHDALEDARAAAEVLLKASEATGLDVKRWLRRVEQPIDPSAVAPAQYRYVPPLKRYGNAEGPLYGETAVFTGKLEMPRSEAADLASEAGCDVVNQVSRKVTMLVVGTQNMSRLAGYDKSSKHRKAEELIADGSDITVLSESDFLTLVDTSTG